MPENILDLEISEHAEMPYDTLGPEDRRLVDAYLEHLRNWQHDDFIRTRSRRLKSDQEIYIFETGTDIVIAFQITGNKVIVLSIFREEVLRKFQTAEKNGQ